jgi:hypothetical protein
MVGESSEYQYIFEHVAHQVDVEGVYNARAHTHQIIVDH